MQHEVQVSTNNTVPIRRRKRLLTDRRIAWLMTLPSILIVLALTVFPLLYSLRASFYQWEALKPGQTFNGLDNYIKLITNDAQFLWAGLITAILMVLSVLVEFLFGLALALILVGKVKGKKWLIPCLILPVTLAPVVVGYTWKLMFDAKYGPINEMLSWIIGSDFKFNWLNSFSGSVFAIVVADVWQWTPFMFLVLLAGLSAVPMDIYEAAAVDGASRWKSFLHITLPMITPAVTIAILIRTLDSLKMFDIVFSMTNGGPGTLTQTISMYIYRLGFVNFRIGYTAAATYLLLIVVTVGTTLFISRMMKGREV